MTATALKESSRTTAEGQAGIDSQLERLYTAGDSTSDALLRILFIFGQFA
jgi:hypothetical protein